MGYCTMCGSEIPSGQNVCSMCYGDMDYGNDGYYRQWAEEEQRRAEWNEEMRIDTYGEFR